MKKFNILKGIPANLPMTNIDTDMIIPKQFLKTIKRTGLGKSLFFEMRYDENAPCALLDFGIKCLISPSFADIFYNNCFKNGMLPIVLDKEKIAEIIEYSERKENIEVNLEDEAIIFGNKKIKFQIDSFKKKCLLEGLDDIALSLEKSEIISSYEQRIEKNKPWLN